jgi:hypothetical protein
MKLDELMQPLNTEIDYGNERAIERENQIWTSILALSRDGLHWPGILKIYAQWAPEFTWQATQGLL